MKIIRHDDGSITVHLPAQIFELPKADSSEALVENILADLRERLEDRLEISAGFIEDGSAPAP